MSEYLRQTDCYLNQINQALDGYLALKDEAYDSVLEAMRYSVMNAGKRIRPILTLEFCRMNGGRAEDALPFACAVEMIHCYSLIHDDLPCMDDDDLRRGKPSCHKAFGESCALLAGDGLLTRAFEIMAESPLGKTNPAGILACIRELSHFSGVDGMIGGQVIDLAIEHQSGISEKLLRTMHLLKTGALIKAACKMGALAAGADSDAVRDAEQYGENLGLAFQIVDDILDITGTVEDLGKPIGSDAGNEKVTFITLCGMKQAEQMAEGYTQNAFRLLEGYQQSDYLKTLTKTMLSRKK